PRQARRHPPPEDPPLRPALHLLREADSLMKQGPERLDPDLVEREPPTGPEDESSQVEPPGLVLGALEPLVRQLAQRLPERAQGRGRPLIAGRVEELLEPLDQPRPPWRLSGRGP